MAFIYIYILLYNILYKYKYHIYILLYNILYILYVYIYIIIIYTIIYIWGVSENGDSFNFWPFQEGIFLVGNGFGGTLFSVKPRRWGWIKTGRIENWLLSHKP